jgi:hypothetical protein
MYEYPVLFPTTSNRETWLQTVQIYDDQTGDLISLLDSNGVPLYAVYLEIHPPRGRGSSSYPYSSTAYYDWSGCGEGVIFATLANYITIPDIGTISIQIPYTAMQTLDGGKTYDVYLRLEDQANADARQILIGKLPIAFGGHGA